MVMKKTYHTVNGRILGETAAGVRTDYLTDALGSVTATVRYATCNRLSPAPASIGGCNRMSADA